MAVDLFAGKSSELVVVFRDGSAIPIDLQGINLPHVTKVAIVWQGDADLDIHAFEYAAEFGLVGHVWSGQPSSFSQATQRMEQDKRGHGYISSSTVSGTHGMNAEVYTFLHHKEQRFGAIALALDYANRGDRPSGSRCGDGSKSEVRFDVYLLRPSGRITQEAGLLPAAPCEQELSTEARFMRSAIPDIRVQR